MDPFRPRFVHVAQLIKNVGQNLCCKGVFPAPDYAFYFKAWARCHPSDDKTRLKDLFTFCPFSGSQNSFIPCTKFELGTTVHKITGRHRFWCYVMHRHTDVGVFISTSQVKRETSRDMSIWIRYLRMQAWEEVMWDGPVLCIPLCLASQWWSDLRINGRHSWVRGLFWSYENGALMVRVNVRKSAWINAQSLG